MTKVIAKTARYSLIVVGLVIVALLAAPFFIDVNVYKQQIEQRVEDETGRKLSIGNMNASLFPWVGIELDDVHLANRPGYAERDFLSVKRLDVKLALMPLLSKRFEFKHFEVLEPVLYLERRSDADNNWGDLVASGNQSAAESKPLSQSAASPGELLLPALLAESLSLVDGKVTWVDADSKPVVLSDLDVALRDVQLIRPVEVSVSGQLSGNAFELDANVGPVGDLAQVNMLALPVQGHFKADKIHLQPFRSMITDWPDQLGDIAKAFVGVAVRIEQRPDGKRLAEGELQVNAAHNAGLVWKVEMTEMDQLQVNQATLTLDGKALLNAKGSVRQLFSNPVFQLRIDSQPVGRAWLNRFVPQLKGMYAGHPAAWKTLAFNALVAGDSKRMDIRDLQLMLDQELLQVSGSVLYQGPDIHLRMAAKQLHLDAWLPQAKKKSKAAVKQHAGLFVMRQAVAAEAMAAQTSEAEPDLRFLKSWTVSSKVQINKLYLRGLEMGNFSASIHGSKGRFDLNPLSFNLSGGKVTEKASIDVTSYPAKWTESVHVTGVRVAPVLKTLAGMDMLEGTLARMDTRLRATGLTQAALQNLRGSGEILLRDGKIKGFDIAGSIRKFTDPAAYKQGPQATDFGQLSGSFKIINGVVGNRDLFMSSPLLRVTGDGTVNLVQQSLDYNVKARVVGTLKGQGDTVLRKGVSIPLRITGPLAAPKVRPVINAKTLLENAPALLNKGKLGGALGKILGGGQGAQPAIDPAKGAATGARIQPKAKPPQEPPATPKEKLLEGLGGMIPGF